MKDFITGTAVAMWIGLLATISFASMSFIAWLARLSVEHPEWHVGYWLIGAIAVLVWVGSIASACLIRRAIQGASKS